MQTKIELIGVSGPTLSEERLNIVRRCGVVASSERHKSLLAGENVSILPIAPVTELLDAVATALEQSDVAVLASGDPLFYGIGRTLIERFGAERVAVHPALSAVQLACARFKVAWDDMVILSLHGREPGDLPARILPHHKVMLFTDPRNMPSSVAATLLAALAELGDGQCLNKIQVRVAENLGLEQERIVTGDLAQIAASQFGPLNIMLIEQERGSEPSCIFGLTETELYHSRGLITKDEVRAVTLHQLRLPNHGVFWDVGGGSGSISIEAAKLCPSLAIYCIEQKAEQIENLQRNIVRHGTYNIRPVRGSAPEIFASLPDPERIFIGGSGGALPEIIAASVERLQKGGRIVVNAVRPATADSAPQLLAQQGLRVELRTIRISRRCFGSETEQELNPITIITGSN